MNKEPKPKSTGKRQLRCPHCGKEIHVASMLGSLNVGVKKTYTDADRARLRDRLTEVRKRRWPHKIKEPTTTTTTNENQRDNDNPTNGDRVPSEGRGGEV